MNPLRSATPGAGFAFFRWHVTEHDSVCVGPKYCRCWTIWRYLRQT